MIKNDLGLEKYLYQTSYTIYIYIYTHGNLQFLLLVEIIFYSRT